MTSSISKKLISLLALLVFVSGCASTSDSLRGDWKNCALLGGAVGGGVGAVGDSGDEAIAIAAGALLGSAVCALLGPGDSDGDGINDDKDQCPNSPKGSAVDSTGCPADSDGDGVADATDRCPNTPRGAKVDATGCELDSDGDGVVDRIDQCPGTPRGIMVDGRGCPKEQTFNLQGVNFEFDSAILTGNAKMILDSVATQLKGASLKVRVAGHTDDWGDTGYNQRLSLSRAHAVVSYLVEKGVSRGSIMAEGYGESRPIADNTSDAGRAKNRRVEFTLSK